MWRVLFPQASQRVKKTNSFLDFGRQVSVWETSLFHGGRRGQTPFYISSSRESFSPLFIGVTVVKKIIQVSCGQFHNTSSVHCTVCLPPQVKSPSIVNYSPILSSASSHSLPSGKHHNVVQVQALFSKQRIFDNEKLLGDLSSVSSYLNNLIYTVQGCIPYLQMAVGITSWLYVSQGEDFARHTLHCSFFQH